MHYIVMTRATDIWLVGPFPTEAMAADYGATAQAKMWDDDPRWQTIELADTFGLRVEGPANITVRAGAYQASCRSFAA